MSTATMTATMLLIIIVPRLIFLILRLVRNKHRRVLLIMHPFCDAGGGGERVLFCALKGLLNKLDEHKWRVVICTGDKATAREILDRARMRFGDGSSIPQSQYHRVEFIRLQTRSLVLGETWPRLTLIGQSCGSMIMGLEALVRLGTAPDVYFDSMGYAFTYPVVKFLTGCPIICYVHYPIISSDMLKRVVERRPTYNNNERVSSSHTLTRLKSAYYIFFSYLYSFVGRFANVTMTNSTWTSNHIASLWGGKNSIVYPPCLSELASSHRQQAAPAAAAREPFALSIGQFRPEKDHRLQLAVVKALIDHHAIHTFKLVMIGSVRGMEDETRVQELRDYATNTLGLIEGQHFEFELSIPKTRVDELMSRALLGFHTMWNEHFGIGIVEMMAAGVVTIAHDSGGPKMDIIVPAFPEAQYVGFLARDTISYADAVATVLKSSPNELEQLRKRASSSTLRYSEERFWNGVWNAISDVFDRL